MFQITDCAPVVNPAPPPVPPQERLACWLPNWIEDEMAWEEDRREQRKREENSAFAASAKGLVTDCDLPF